MAAPPTATTPATATTPGARRPRRVSRLEIGAAGGYAAVILALLVIEPDILQAPFASARAVLLTFGGALLAVVALVAMIRCGVSPVVRVLVIGIPTVLLSWWLLEPFFVDDAVNDRFSTSIAAQRKVPPAPTAPTASAPAVSPPERAAPASSTAPSPTVPAPAPSPGPQLLGSGTFAGLAGHDGTGDAGIFRLEDGSLALRLENFDIDNGPDLELYLVPGAGSYSPRDGSVHLGALKGNVGNQTYEIPRDFTVGPGEWTVLVWCEAFTVEFVGASLTVA